MTQQNELYQQVILEHNKSPRNYRKMADATHSAEGYNPLCGDHFWVYARVDADGRIQDVSFEGEGCAISKASASMMTATLKGKTVEEAQRLAREFTSLIKGEIAADPSANSLGRLNIFSGIWKYPSRVKCAVLAWHAAHGALEKQERVSSE